MPGAGPALVTAALPQLESLPPRLPASPSHLRMVEGRAGGGASVWGSLGSKPWGPLEESAGPRAPLPWMALAQEQALFLRFLLCWH